MHNMIYIFDLRGVLTAPDLINHVINQNSPFIFIVNFYWVVCIFIHLFLDFLFLYETLYSYPCIYHECGGSRRWRREWSDHASPT